MLLILKFLYTTFLLPPGILLIALVGLCIRHMHTHHTWPHGLGLFAVVFYVCTTPWLANQLIGSLENDYTPPPVPQGDVIVMLGGGATLDTPNMGGEGHLSGFAANRLLTCVQLYHVLHVPILVSGGKVFETTGVEAEIAKTILVGLGVPASSVIVENRSLNTTDNARYTKELLDFYGYTRPVLVTSAFHMPRAVRQFEKYTMAVMPYPTDYQVNVHSDFSADQLWPSAGALFELQLAIKEYMGLVAVAWY